MLHKTFFILILLLATSCSSQSEPQQKSRPIRAIKVRKEPYHPQKSFPGRIRASDRSTLAFRVSGQLIERPAFVGMQAKRGQLLAELDPIDYQAKLEDIEGRIQETYAKLLFALSDFDRAQRLQTQDPGAISKRTVEQRSQEVYRLEGEWRALKAQRELAYNALSYTQLLAPYNGTVVATYVDNFEYLNAQQPVLRLLNDDQVEMVIDVPEDMVILMPKIELFTVSLDSLPEQTFEATVKEIGSEASQMTRTYPVTLLLQNRSGYQLLAGMTGEARPVQLRDVDDLFAIILPVEALLPGSTHNEDAVWIYDEKSSEVHRRSVIRGKINQRGIVIAAGLNEGEWVVTAGVQLIEEGQKVRLLPDKS